MSQSQGRKTSYLFKSNPFGVKKRASDPSDEQTTTSGANSGIFLNLNDQPKPQLVREDSVDDSLLAQLSSPFTIGKYTLLGEKHNNNEDRATYESFELDNQNYCFAGVFDGHGGSNCAQYVSDVVSTHVKDMFSKEDAWESRDEVMQELFQKIDKEFCSKAIPRKDYSGCCATIVVCKEEDVVVGNIGDCRAIIVPLQANGSYTDPVEITVDHRADCTSENLRINEAGGKVMDGRIMSLQPSRSFGDVDVKQAAGKDVVIANPDVDTIHIFKPSTVKKRNMFGTLGSKSTKGKPRKLSKVNAPESNRAFMIIATDGVWDVLDSKQASDCVKKSLKSTNGSGGSRGGFSSLLKRRNSKGSEISDSGNDAEMAAEKLVKLAKEKGSDDDITVVVILF